VTRFLVVFDVDSTLIEDEVIELLADAAGKRAEVADVTERAMRGELDFSSSLRARVKTLVGLPDSVIEETYARIRVTVGATELIEAIHLRGGKVGAVSGGFNQLLEPLAKRLGLDFWRANQLEILEHTLTGEVVGDIIDRPAKASALAEWAGELGLTASATIAVGDGANDLDMLSVAALGVAFNAKPKVRASADVVVDRQDLRELIPLLP
jgi:phosphoserine phosphatase